MDFLKDMPVYRDSKILYEYGRIVNLVPISEMKGHIPTPVRNVEENPYYISTENWGNDVIDLEEYMEENFSELPTQQTLWEKIGAFFSELWATIKGWFL